MIIAKSMILRFLILAVIMITATGLFLGNQQKQPKQFENTQRDLMAVAKAIDVEIDSILAQFQVDIKKVRKRAIAIPNTNLNRIERRVTIPPDVDPLHINQAMNIMAHQYDGRAIGSENIKEKTVSIHIKLDDFILETIILKPKIDKKLIKRKK